MTFSEKNYEQIREAMLHVKGSVNPEDWWLEYLTELLGFSAKSVQGVLSAMKEDQSILEINGLLYIIDGIQYRVGTLRVVRDTFGFVGDRKESVYIAAKYFNDALDHDSVLVQCFENNGAIEGTVVHVLKRERLFILGTFVKKNGSLYFQPYEAKYPYVFVVETSDNEVGQRVILKIDRVENGSIYGTIHAVLGMADEPGIDVLSVLYVHDLVTEFSNEALDQAASIIDEIPEDALKGRIDHRNQNIITVDGEDAKDLDDAIYLEKRHEGYRLYVHIADVSYYVTPKSPLDVDAFERTSSIYLVDRVVPMLPKNLSNGVCSLHPNVDRLTLTCMMDFDLKGNVDNYAIYPSIINSKRRMSYNEINQNESWGNETEMIHEMLNLADILHYKREQAGSIDFDSDEAKFIVDGDGNVLDIFRRTQGESEAMIEAFMVSANETVARHCRYLELPIMYRVHEKPDVDKMKALSHTLRTLGYRMKGSLENIHPKALQKAMAYFKNEAEGPVVSRLMIRSMSKARYATEPLGHFGLALEDYAHFTSPIRRYPDMWLHQCLRQYVFNSDFSTYTQNQMYAQEGAEHVSSKERDIMEAERDVEKIKKAQFMVHKKGEIEEGWISGFSNYGMFVELANTVEGVIPFRSMRDHMVVDMVAQKAIGTHSNVTYSLGQKVRIKVESVDTTDHEVEFSLKEKFKGVTRRAKHRKKS